MQRRRHGVAPDTVEIRDMGEVVSASLQEQAIRAILLSFLGMAIVVFIIFRSLLRGLIVTFKSLIPFTLGGKDIPFLDLSHRSTAKQTDAKHEKNKNSS